MTFRFIINNIDFVSQKNQFKSIKPVKIDFETSTIA